MKNAYPEIFLKAGRETTLLRGHPWIFSGAVEYAPADLDAGEVVVAVSRGRRPIALGFFNPRSDIIFRLLTTDTDATIDSTFWSQRIKDAAALRERVVPPRTSAYRLINAEGDLMPGLIVDRYGDHLVLSIDTAGIERRREEIMDILIRQMRPSVIYERSDGRARRREGLQSSVGPVFGTSPRANIVIEENGLSFEVDCVSGQKTGFFLDQRSNRTEVEKLSEGAIVLNCFSYTGAFSVYCARGGAKRIISVEASSGAAEVARRNLETNGYSSDRHPVVQADVFEYLRGTTEVFDLIIMDPPAFAKSHADLRGAERGYRDINLWAARRLRHGGILATFSCSNHVGRDLFEKIVLNAICDAGRTARLLACLGSGPDHPTTLAHVEGRYLKGLLLCVTG